MTSSMINTILDFMRIYQNYAVGINMISVYIN